MSNIVQTAKLKDLCSKIGSGATPKGGKESYSDHGIPLIRSQNVLMNEFSIDGLAYLNDSQADELKNVEVQADDVLLNITGDSVARVCQAPKWVCPARVNQHVAIIRPFSERLNPTFLRYYLVSPKMQDYLHGLASSGATRQALTKVMIEEFDIPLPQKNIQDKIACILNKLDQKIELNKKMNETIESMAKAIFKEWFIDFGPVKEKVEGKKPFGMDDKTASLFPDKFIDSELGQIPTNWIACRLSEVIELLSGGTPKTTNPDYWNGNIPWFSVVDTPKGSDIWLIDTEKKITLLGVDNSATKILPIGTTIVSARGTVGNLALVAVPTAMNQSCYGIKGRGYDDLFTYLTISNMVSQLKQNSHGSVFDTITRDTFNGVSVVVPPKEDPILKKFETIVAPLFEKIKNNVFESATLAQTRDLLLPMLISGELQLNEVSID